MEPPSFPGNYFRNVLSGGRILRRRTVPSKHAPSKNHAPWRSNTLLVRFQHASNKGVVGYMEEGGGGYNPHM